MEDEQNRFKLELEETTEKLKDDFEKEKSLLNDEISQLRNLINSYKDNNIVIEDLKKELNVKKKIFLQFT